jgi:hypothetical protein
MNDHGLRTLPSPLKGALIIELAVTVMKMQPIPHRSERPPQPPRDLPLGMFLLLGVVVAFMLCGIDVMAASDYLLALASEDPLLP